MSNTVMLMRALAAEACLRPTQQMIEGKEEGCKGRRCLRVYEACAQKPAEQRQHSA